MSCLRVCWFVFLMLPSLLPGQGFSARDEAIRQEEIALERARRMKALKEQALYEPPPRDINPPPAAPVTRRVAATSPQPAAEPFYFQVVTPQGLVPLDQWRAQEEQARMAASAPVQSQAPPSRAAFRGAESRTMKLAFFSMGSSGGSTDAEEGRAVALAESVPSGQPRAAVAPAEATRPAAAAEIETVAVMEEIPSDQPGGVPKRRLLGFLSAKGLEAALAEAAVPAGSVSEETFPETKEKPPSENGGPTVAPKLFDRFAQRRPADKPGVTGNEAETDEGEEAELLAEAKPRRSFQSESAGEFMNGLGTWLASAKALRPTPGGLEGGQFSGGHADYFTIATPKAPFHVIDHEAGETHLVELEAGTVGRNHGEGEDWAWMQLDSGLMGLMKKRHLRPSVAPEVDTFLAAESVDRGSSRVASRQVQPVRYLEVDLPELPSESGDPGMPLGGGLFPMATDAEAGDAAGGDAAPMAAPAVEELPMENPRPAPEPGGTLPAVAPPLP